MPDFKILKVTIDEETRNEKIYFRVERVGSNTWGGIKKPLIQQKGLSRITSTK